MPLRQRFPAADITPPIQALRARFTRVRAAIDSGVKILGNLLIACVLLSFFASFALHHDEANDRAAWHNPPCTHGCDP